MREVPGSIPTMAVDLLVALSTVVVWSPEVPSYCSFRLSTFANRFCSVFYVMCVVNVSPIQAVDLNFCDSAWDVIVRGQ